MNRCEDYPCCGHTDGLGCNWTYTPEAESFDRLHFMCDHAAGVCDLWEDEDEDQVCYDCGEDYDECVCDDDAEPFLVEDAGLDSSWEE